MFLNFILKLIGIWLYVTLLTIYDVRQVTSLNSDEDCFFRLELTSALGTHNLITGSIPLVARRQAIGCGCTQFTIESSPLKTSTILVLYLSQI